MFFRITKKLLAAFFCLFSIMFFPIVLFAAEKNVDLEKNVNLNDQSLYDLYPNSVMYYYGITGSDALVRIFQGNFHRYPEHIQSIAFAHTLAQDNFLRRIVEPLVGVVQIAGNVTVRNGSNEPKIYEFDPYIMFRWDNLPWNNFINTSFGLGEGVSFDTSIPAIEKGENNNTKRFLNYLVFEATFADPNYPRWQLVTRIHHRSGAYGLYHAGNTGSNDIGLGIRYLFD